MARAIFGYAAGKHTLIVKNMLKVTDVSRTTKKAG